MNLREYVEHPNRGAESVASELSEAFDKPVRPELVERYVRENRTPKRWAKALGLSDPSGTDGDGAAGVTSSPPGGDGRGRQAETPPKPPPGTPVQPTPFQLQAVARDRIAHLHVFAGASLATAVDADGFEHDRGVGGGVAAIWKDKADPIAEAWIKWAEEGNKFAQAFVRMMQVGGAGGELVLGYAMLLGGTAYIMGHMPDNESTRAVYGRYTRYRTVHGTGKRAGAAADAAREPEPAATGAEDFLGGSAG